MRRHTPSSPPMRVRELRRDRFTLALPLTLAMCLAAPALAQEGDTADLMEPQAVEQLDRIRDQIQGADKPQGRPADATAVPSIDLGKPPEPIAPQTTDVETIPARVGLPAAKIDLDPAVIGVAPGQAPPVLLREGQFIVNRRGRLQRIEGSGVMLLVFEPREGQVAADVPMVVQACTTVQMVEELIDQRGLDTPLIVSGQVHTYRGFNYLLPTMMEPAPLRAPDATAQPEETPITEQPRPEAVPQDPDPAQPADTVEPEEDVMGELMQLRQDATPAAPVPTEDTPRDPARPLLESIGELVPTAAKVKIDQAILGIAPEQPLPPLKREGEFLVGRRGRLVRSVEGKSLLFVFDADSAKAPELPMVVQPCRLRESMENLIVERGDSVVFIVSGQVHTYRGANYLLPTMMKLAVDQGNLLN